MKTRFTFLLLSIFMFASVSNSAIVTKDATATNSSESSNRATSNLHGFMDMNRKSFEELTGRKLSLKERLQFKMAQKAMKSGMKKRAGGDLPQWAYIVLSVLALGWLAIGIRSDWKGNDWWISLLLYLCFYFPGLIYSLIVMGKYY